MRGAKGVALSRRMLLLAPVPLALGAAASPPSWLETLRGRASSVGLLRSYDVLGEQEGGGAFDLAHGNCAYVYDNAVAALALLASGDALRARRIGDALLAAQKRDRFFADGRLRNAYAPGTIAIDGPMKMAGWWDKGQRRWLEDGYQAGSATGVVAWAMLLWIGLAKATQDQAYVAAANLAADWVEKTQSAERGFAGGFLGFEHSQQRLTWVSTEHNIDLAAAFGALGRTGSARHAAEFVAAMWDPKERRFASGLRPDGTTSDHSAVDANVWPLLAAGAQPEWRGGLDWVIARHGLPPGAAVKEGVDFNNDRDGIWLEGTAITALACRRQGEARQSEEMLASLRAQTSPGGLIYACTTPTLTTGLSTGLDTHAPDFLYFRRPHIAPTAWAILAAAGANPFPAAGS